VTLQLGFLLLALAASPAQAPSGKVASASAPKKKELRKRALKISDGTGVTELYVGVGTPTSLVFAAPFDGTRMLLADVNGRFFEPQTTDRTIVLVPKSELKAGEAVALSVTMEDGTVLPFVLTTNPLAVDLQVDVEVTVTAPVSQDSAQALKAKVAELQSSLDECKQSSGNSGIGKVASLILAQDLDQPQAFTVERHNARNLDKQSRLLVETRQVYRLFDLSYVVLTIENRDPSKSWVLDRPEVAATGSASTTEVRVTSWVEELNSLPPGEISKVVVAFTTPSQDTGQRFTLRLLEKNGSRHVALDGLKL
jgi:uncharacterized protein (TIGR02268 family)